MISNLSLFIGLRYAFSSRRDGFLSFVSLFSLGAMALGVTVLIVVLSVMNGFDREIKDRMLDILPHATMTHPEGLENWRQVLGDIEGRSGDPQAYTHSGSATFSASPYIDGQGLVAFDGRHQALSLQGVLLEDAHTLLDTHLIAGDLELLSQRRFGVVLGQLLARNLGVVPGDKVLITLPELNITPAGAFPRIKRMTVAAIFQVGGEVDSHVAFMLLPDAQTLFRTGTRVDGLRLWFDDPYTLPGFEDIQSRWGDEFLFSSWQEEASDLFRALKLEKTMVGLLLSVIIGVAAFNIIAALVLMVNEKRSDIAVLRSYGASSRTIARIFRVQGCVLGIAGIGVGAIVGCLLATYIGPLVAGLEALFSFNIFDPSLFFISQLPSRLQWQDVAWVVAGSMLLTLLATVYPAWRASQVNPAEALQSEH